MIFLSNKGDIGFKDYTDAREYFFTRKKTGLSPSPARASWKQPLAWNVLPRTRGWRKTIATKNDIGPWGSFGACRHFWSHVFRRRYFVRGGAFLIKGSFL
jgi:hypothetical protein